MDERNVATFLGFFSLGLGLAQILSPHTFTRAFHTRNRFGVVRTVYGAREIAVGIGILTARDPAPWVWARVAGDVLDLATLGVAHDDEKPDEVRRNIGVGAASVLGVTALDVWCALQLDQA